MEFKDMKISVIIPAYNEEENLPKIIKSLRNQTKKPYEIIVVDNNSKDKTYQVAKKLADNVFKCKEQGICPARNYGAKKARGEVVAFLDADTTVDKEWVETIEKNFKKDKKMAGVTGIGFYDEKNIFKKIFLDLWQNFVFLLCKFQNKSERPLLISNNMAIKKDLFEKVNGWDNLIAEDCYLGLKLQKFKNNKYATDRKMKVIYSSRRFDKQGIIKTYSIWFSSVLKRKSQDSYELHDKL